MTARATRWALTTKRQWAPVSLLLAALLVIAFSPAIVGGRTLLHASWDTASILSGGAFDATPRPPFRLQRTSDPGAPAWQTEAWFGLIGNQLWSELNPPLWNPYSAYGTPLAASGQPQPFFPLAMLLSLHLTAWTYNLFIVARLFLAGLLSYLFARNFFSALPSLFAAVTFMLSGYFIIFLNMPHLSVEVLTPGVFLTFELLLRRNSWRAAAGAAAMILLGNVAGMPESMFLIMVFASLYVVCRIAFSPELRARAVSLLVKFVAAVVLGFALSAFVLLPFVEFVRLAHDTHQPGNVGGIKAGLGHDGDYHTIIQYLLPLIFGPILNSIFANFAGWSGLRGYWGVAPFLFAVAAVLSLLFAGRALSNTRRFVVGFFTITLVLMLMKRFGSALINWIGDLPLSDMVVYPKYQEPLIALCVAMLAGAGFAALIERRLTPRLLAITAIATLTIMLALAAWYVPEVRTLPRRSAQVFFFLSLALGVGLVVFTAALAWLTERVAPDRRAWLLRGFVGVVSLELVFNFIVPCFYLLSTLAPLRADPYAGAPYIEFLRAQITDHSRIFARENNLYPNWSSVFGLADVRSLDALHYYRYRLFIRNFLAPPGDIRTHGDLADRFTGGEFPFAFDTETDRRFLALSSVRYLISDSDYGASSKVTDEILIQHHGEAIWGFGPDVFRIEKPAKATVRGLFQHPPSRRVSYKTRIDPNEPVFEATILIKGEGAEKSDGVGFQLEVREGEKTETVFQTVLNPQGVPEDRGGRAIRIDLGAYSGRDLELLFSTDPGPAGDDAYDWAGWAGPRFTSKEGAAAPSPFRKLYDGELRVYEVPSVMPRAALFRAIEIMPDDQVLARLKDPAFDPTLKVAISRESLPAEAAAVSLSLAAAAGTPARAASIVHYQSQRVQIEAESDEPALLMLNDTNFPGWRAYLNGQPVPIVNADYLFRGVFVAAGKSIIEFRYEPGSFRAGVAISLAAFVTLGGLMFHERRKRRPKPNSPERTVS